MKKRSGTIISFCFIAILLLITEPLLSRKIKPLTPTKIRSVITVGDRWVKANYKKMKVFDVRKKAEYIEGHIPGAVSVPYKEKSRKAANFNPRKDKFDIRKFPVNKSEPIIVYCNGPRCWKSYKASVLLKRNGYKKIYWYRNNGFPGWKAKGYPVE